MSKDAFTRWAMIIVFAWVAVRVIGAVIDNDRQNNLSSQISVPE